MYFYYYFKILENPRRKKIIVIKILYHFMIKNYSNLMSFFQIKDSSQDLKF
jgi:hypothetical protein